MIVSNYRSAAYFDFYFESLLDVFRHRPEYLFELNISLWHWLESSLKISVNYSLSDDYMAHPDSHTLIDWRNKWRSRRDLNDTKAYAQVFEYRHGFVSGLSVLDLVFCCGPESIAILKETN